MYESPFLPSTVVVTSKHPFLTDKFLTCKVIIALCYMVSSYAYCKISKS